MKKFSFEEAKSIGNAISPEELKKIGTDGLPYGEYKCICYMQFPKQIFVTAPYYDADNSVKCKTECENICDRNQYCKSVTTCFSKEKNCPTDEGSGVHSDLGCRSGSDSESGSGSDTEGEIPF